MFFKRFIVTNISVHKIKDYTIDFRLKKNLHTSVKFQISTNQLIKVI